MFIYVLQIREALRGRIGPLLWFAVFATVVWVLWVIKVLVSRRYVPWTAEHHETTSVVVPVVDEPEGLFHDVLGRIQAQSPDEVIVVINGPRNEPLEAICEEHGVTWTWTPVPGKRNAIAVGTRMATQDVMVLVDSDTLWTDGTLVELLKPFADQRIGGVTTRQRILGPRRNFLTRWADWQENSRGLYSMPCQSVLGHIGCLPGRTIALRTKIVRDNLDRFLTDRFLGIFLEVSDDRNLTSLALMDGWRTVYQSTSLVYTDAPTQVRKMYRQQLRWARGSQYNTLRMLPWMLAHTPLLAVFMLADIVLPFLLLGSILTWIYHARTHTGVDFLSPTLGLAAGWFLVVLFIVAGAAFSTWLRQYRHLLEVPRDYPWMPAYVLFSSFFLMPIRLLGFVVMGHVPGWGTRSGGYMADTDTDDGNHRRWNLWATVPYLLAVLVIGVELALVAHLSA